MGFADTTKESENLEKHLRDNVAQKLESRIHETCIVNYLQL